MRILFRTSTTKQEEPSYQSYGYQQTHLGERNVQVDANQDIFSFQVDLIGELFHAQLCLGEGRRTKGTKGEGLQGSHTGCSRKKGAEHDSSILVDRSRMAMK